MPSPGNADLLLDEQACFALYAASRAVTDVYRPLLAELGLTYPQYLVLLVLWEADSRPVKQIGEALQLDYGTLSPLLKRLETSGLVSRHRLATDERSVTISLTPEGDALRDRAAGIPSAIGCALGLDDDGRRQLISTLRQLTAATLATHSGGTHAQP
ncbi:MarR family winged helix-turn-helix transcriptional regulator [Amycolatopsis sp. H20-H5]|uniref:MarR family winged helix-turn-helix transcriptional regulator n=1 Tax=Amycolatopsis sp. H20-H5 TaxID=3046309 RepID=UPI002DBA8D0F|nr:MarR family winged helix-turn-helix transcriptional regulator [Amycolatopsis sp. H20-H5]MEC3977675.1 MarR family winged helix-turn-helix transcriptional regulator [Amycolatopsis sp. H20-H5]